MGPTAAGHRRDVGRLGRYAGEIDVADKPAVLEPIDADVDHDRAGPHHLRQKQRGSGAKLVIPKWDRLTFDIIASS